VPLSLEVSRGGKREEPEWVEGFVSCGYETFCIGRSESGKTLPLIASDCGILTFTLDRLRGSGSTHRSHRILNATSGALSIDLGSSHINRQFAYNVERLRLADFNVPRSYAKTMTSSNARESDPTTQALPLPLAEANLLLLHVYRPSSCP
jgi:hypothetical protein